MITQVVFSSGLADSNSQPFSQHKKRKNHSDQPHDEAHSNGLVTDTFEPQYPQELTVFPTYVEELKAKRFKGQWPLQNVAPTQRDLSILRENPTPANPEGQPPDNVISAAEKIFNTSLRLAA